MKRIKKPKVIVLNLYAGPGTGKSSSMGGIFAELKWRNINCEMAPEFAKEKVWEKSTDILRNQIYIFGKQLQTIKRVEHQVDVVITDSPLLLSLIYGHREKDSFKQLVIETYNDYDNLNILLKRSKPYNPKGRLQSEVEAKEKDHEIRAMLAKNNIVPIEMETGRESVIKIADMICEKLKGK